MKLKFFEIRSYRSCVKTKIPIHDELTGLIGKKEKGDRHLLGKVSRPIGSGADVEQN